jgi:hypothetical protein
MAVVKYVGRVDFAAGIWAGVELRNPLGKHDGEVQGKRLENIAFCIYFGGTFCHVLSHFFGQVLSLQAQPRLHVAAQVALRPRHQRGEAAQTGIRISILKKIFLYHYHYL